MNVKIKLITALFVIAFQFVTVFSQEKNVKSNKIQLLPQKVENLLIESRSLQTEFMADIYLKTISLKSFNNQKRKKELLSEIFGLIFDVKRNFPRKFVVSNGRLSSIRPLFISYADEKNIDKLSLQLRVINEVLKYDKTQAKLLFNQIALDLNIPALNCEDRLVFNVQDFYSSIEKFAVTSFNQEQIKQGERLIFLSPFFENIKSPVQIKPLLKILSKIDLTENEFVFLVSSISASIKQISDDDRAFSYTLNYDNATLDIENVIKKLPEDDTLKSELVNSYRNYLVKNLSGNRCRDSVDFEQMLFRISIKAEKKEQLSSIEEIFKNFPINEANKILFRANPIKYEEIKPFKTLDYKFPTNYLSQGKWAELNNEIEDLEFWKSNEKTTEENKNKVEWQEKFAETLDLIAGSEKLEGEDEFDEFNQKCMLYSKMLQIAYPATLKESTAKYFLALLEKKQFKVISPSEWLYQFDAFFSEVSELKSPDKTKINQLIENSKDQTITAYLNLKKEILNEKLQEKQKK
jgi:hypothetical protein